MISGDEMKKMTEAMVSNFSKTAGETPSDADVKSLEDAMEQLRN